MRRVLESELESDFERQYGWGDDERHLHNPNRRKASVMGATLRLESVLALVDRHCRPGARIADFACAQGNYALSLAERGYEVTAVDLQPDFLRYARKKHTHGHFETVEASVIDYRAETPYDCVLLGEIIEHVAFPDQLLRAAFENLAPGGLVIVTTPNGAEYGAGLPTYSQVTNLEELIPRQFHWGDHLFLYTEQELRGLFKAAGFEPLECLKINSSYVSQLKGVRYLLPLRALRWMERRTRRWPKRGKDSAGNLIMVGRRASS